MNLNLPKVKRHMEHHSSIGDEPHLIKHHVRFQLMLNYLLLIHKYPIRFHTTSLVLNHHYLGSDLVEIIQF